MANGYAIYNEFVRQFVGKALGFYTSIRLQNIYFSVETVILSAKTFNHFDRIVELILREKQVGNFNFI